jgi:hypothetical protein
MSKHNKKRNIGIVYEQLVHTIAQATIDGDRDRADRALSIVKKHFSPGTELYREFRLINALVNTSVKSDALASRILEETKLSAKSYDTRRLRCEKSGLIGDINRSFDRSSFYRTPVKNYRLLATIHTLLEGWRSRTPEIGTVLKYESQLHDWLLQEKVEPSVKDMKTSGVNDLTVKIMRESFNKKYGSALNESQRRLLQAVALGAGGEGLVKEMRAQKETALRTLELYRSQCDSRIVEQKIPRVLESLGGLDPDDTSDRNVARFMTVSQLCDELTEKKNV